MKKVALSLLALLVLLFGILAFRAATLDSRQIAVAPAPARAVDAAAVADTLARAIRIPTVSRLETAGAAPDLASFADLHALFAERFPLVSARLSRETIGGASLLYTWRGSDPSLRPLLLTGHQDVVPVEPGTERRWTHAPFSGDVAGGFVWGRGAIDDKAGVIQILSAVEALLAQGFVPRRTVLLFFGHDEERGGEEGAAAFARRLAAMPEAERPELLLDEWMPIATGLLPGLEQPVALIRIAEKAYLTVELSTTSEGGHSSMPPRSTAIGRLARAIARLEALPMPARLAGPPRAMLETLAPELPLPQRLALGNLWLFSPLVVRQLAARPSSDAMLRTTTAATVIRGGIKDNVLPARATALVNFRILPGDTVAGVLDHVRRTIDDPEVQQRPLGEPHDPHPSSPVDSEGFRAIAKSLREVAPGTLVAPALLVGTSDARWYEGTVAQVYGFRPIRLAPPDFARFHGTDERVAIDDLALGVRFFARVIENGAGS